MPQETLANFMNLSMPYAVGFVFSSVLTVYPLWAWEATCGSEKRACGGKLGCMGEGVPLPHITHVTYLSSEGCPMPLFLVRV